LGAGLSLEYGDSLLRIEELDAQRATEPPADPAEDSLA